MMRKVMLLSMMAALCAAGSVLALPPESGHWPLDGNADDVSGNDYHGTLGGTTSFTGGQIGDGLDTSANGWVMLPVEAWNVPMADADGYTACYWSYTTNGNHKSITLRAETQTPAEVRYLGVHGPWTNDIIYDTNDGSGSDNQRVQWNDQNAQWVNKWSHWAFVCENGRQEIYHDGQVVASGTGPTGVGVGVTDFYIGSFNGTYPFQGIMDDVRLYNVALEAADIAAIMAGEVGNKPKAHTPAPTGDAVNPMELDPDNYGKISWQDPNTAAQGGDPNLVSVDSYDITYYIVNTADVTADDPNWARPGQVYYGGTGVSSPYAIAFDNAADTDGAIYWDQTMFWRVDTHVTWNSTEITENPVIGANWRFATRPEYIAPTITTFGSVITAMDILPAALSAEVETDSISIANHPLNAPVFTVLTDDLAFPDGADAPLTDTTVDYANPTATLEPDQPGLYKVLLEVDDGITFLEALAVVDVYADDCQAAKDAGNWVGANYFDRDGDCFVELEDYSEFAAEWLDDRSMYTQAEDTTPAAYVPADVYENRIETEWAALGPIARTTGDPTGFLDLTNNDMGWVADDDPNMYGDDPNSCSDHPMWNTAGAPQLREPSADGAAYGDNVSGARFSNARAGNIPQWADYKINVQTAGAPVDVYANFASNAEVEVRFTGMPSPIEIVDDTTLDGITAGAGLPYGIITLPNTGGYNNYFENARGIKIGTVTFNSTGEQRVRMSWGEAVNFDWISFDW